MLINKSSTVFDKKGVSELKTSVNHKNAKLYNDVIELGEKSVNNEKLPIETHNFGETSTLWNVSGLPNPDIQCYANASLQTLLHCISIRQRMFENPEQNALYFALQKYISGHDVDVMALRALAGKQYIEKRQQDVAEFITHLCDKSNNLVSEMKCPTCNNTRIYEPTNNYILSLALPNTNLVKLQDIINFNINKWNDTGLPCNYACQSFNKEKTLLRTNNRTLILQLNLFIVDSNATVRKINDLRIKNLDEEIIVINKSITK